MKNALKPLSIITLCLMSILFGSMRYQEVLFVPWGEQERELRHVAYPGLHTGPLSFQVDGETVTIFDTENKKLKTFGSEGFRSSETLEQEYVIDFYKDGDILYTLQPQAVYVNENGLSRCVDLLDDPKIMYDGLRRTTSGIVATHQNEVTCFGSRSLKKEAVSAIRVTRSLPASVNIDMNGETYSLYVPDVGSVEYLGACPNGSHYLYIETITRHVPLEVRRDIYLIGDRAEILDILHLPQQKFTYVFKEFVVGPDGELYHMHSAKDGIHIIKWTPSKTEDMETSYPEAFIEPYHFNQYIEAEPETAELPVLAKTAGAVTRAEALATADDYVTHTWTATAANIGVTELVTTPSWIRIGQNQRIPYQWGGWSTIQQFDDGIAAGKLAGDITTGSTVDLANAVGADCSGFVSVCWTSGRYSTSSFHYVTTELPSYYDLLPADATNYAGHHIRMVVEWTSDGRLVQIEETASGTPGWAARYYTWRLSDITSYIPIRYNNIQNSMAPRPTLLTLTNTLTNSTLTWTADENTPFTGYRIYGKNPSTDYTLIAEVPKGTFSATVNQSQYIYYDYFVAGYVDGDSANFNPSDTYASMKGFGSSNVLIVDGFDRNSGSYGLPMHAFVSRTAEAIRRANISISSCANDAVINGSIDLTEYDCVWWICGDESTADETFDATEQDRVEAYLKQGGKLFVSGSEIAWDLDNKGSTADKAFIHDYLKAMYSLDDADNYHVTGHDARALEGVDLYFSETGAEPGTYEEDYPDALGVSGGSQVVLKYGNDLNAGVAFTGTFPGGTAEGQVVTVGFPFEVIIDTDDMKDLAQKVLIYFGFDPTSDVDEIIPGSYALEQNYPNPFNPVTTIQYKLAESADVVIRVFDMKGREVRALPQGHREAGTYGIIFNGTMLPSGMYVYGLEINGEMVITSKMILMK